MKSSADSFSQMHSQDGPPLSLDIELRVPFHFSAFHPVPILRRGWNELSRVSSFPEGIYYLGQQKLARRKNHSLRR